MHLNIDPWHSGTVEGALVSQQDGFRFESGSSVWSLHVVVLLPTNQWHAGYINAKLHAGPNERLNGFRTLPYVSALNLHQLSSNRYGHTAHGLHQNEPGEAQGVYIRNGSAGRIYSGAQIDLDRPNFTSLSHLSHTCVCLHAYPTLSRQKASHSW